MALGEGIDLLGIRQVGKVQADNSIAQVMEVSFRVDGHGPFTEDIPLDRYTTENVEAQVARQVAEIRKTQNLFKSE